MAHLPADELISKKRNRRRRNRPPGAADNTAWAVMTPQELWKNICQEAKNYFDFSLEWCVGAWQAVGPSDSPVAGRRAEGAVGSGDETVSPVWRVQVQRPLLRRGRGGSWATWAHLPLVP